MKTVTGHTVTYRLGIEVAIGDVKMLRLKRASTY